jgi:hypothetical protein
LACYLPAGRYVRRMNDSDFNTALDSLADDLVPRSALDVLLAAVQAATQESCRQEAYERAMQVSDLTPTQREQELALRCHVLSNQLQRSIRVSRYLFSLIDEVRDGRRDKDDAVVVLSKCPRSSPPGPAHAMRARRRSVLIRQAHDH